MYNVLKGHRLKVNNSVLNSWRRFSGENDIWASLKNEYQYFTFSAWTKIRMYENSRVKGEWGQGKKKNEDWELN